MRNPERAGLRPMCIILGHSARGILDSYKRLNHSLMPGARIVIRGLCRTRVGNELTLCCTPSDYVVESLLDTDRSRQNPWYRYSKKKISSVPS